MKQNFALVSILIFLIFTAFSSCDSKGRLPRDNKGREDFNVFIEKFYSDINFQLDRIDFPITGKKMEDGRFEIIEKNSWQILKPLDPNDKNIKVYNLNISDDLIEQQVVVNQAFSIEMQFSLNQVSKEWYLSSYTGINGIAANANIDPLLTDSTRRVRIIHPDSLKNEN